MNVRNILPVSAVSALSALVAIDATGQPADLFVGTWRPA
jgi:hypothetical protein